MQDFFNVLYQHIISVILLTTLASGIVTALFPSKTPEHKLKSVCLIFSGIIFVLSLILYFQFNCNYAGLQFCEKMPWIPSLNINYSVGVDGISLFLVLLTTFMIPLVTLSINTKTAALKYYFALYFFLEFTMLGTFFANDLVLFYVFWELMLIPMYMLIGIWGGPNRIYATVKFFIYTFFGSIFMLFGLIWVITYFYNANGFFSFEISELAAFPFSLVTQNFLFWLFAVAFMIKVPVFPFHTWLPHAHVEAPTGGSVILAAVLLKMGTYGLLRFCLPMFPDASNKFAILMTFLGAFAVLYGALMSYAQTDLKKLIAYSSVSHMGVIIAGIFALNHYGISGAIVQMINHGLSTGALFLLAGVIYERRHTREISEFGGLAKVMPLYSTIFMIVTFSSIGLPGLNGFIGEFLILLGAFKFSWPLALLTSTGVIFGAVYMLYAYEKIFLGQITNEKNSALNDLTFIEKASLAPILIFIFVIGVYPSFITAATDAAVKNISSSVLREYDIKNTKSSGFNNPQNFKPSNSINDKKL